MDLREEIIRIDNLELLAQQVVEGFITGLHKSPYHGFSVEFAEHRQYNAGESTRNIDWKLFARSERLYVKRFEEETNLRCQVLIDHSSSMFYPSEKFNKLRYAVVAAASLMHVLRKQRDAVGLTTFSNEIEHFIPPKSSSSHHMQLLNTLHQLVLNQRKQSRTDVAGTLHEIAERIHKRSMVVLFSDMFDGVDDDVLFDALQHLKFNKHEVILFHTTDHQAELNFEFENRPYTFEDMETGDRVKLFPNQIKETYTKQMSDYYARLREKCAQYHIDYVPCDINAPLDQVLMPFLVKRQKMSV